MKILSQEGDKNDGAEVRSELLFLDLVKYLEHIGDNCLNIMQALNQIKV